ncbi:MAG TPA: amino acid adenylation domain-containing protein, partial [Chitinophaga sp.]|uniref:non-ribosomal peptide synthetase n=1 Tax=Chitinophaga sp. TaxID=1869181 RepID=UPI002C63C2AE
DLRKHLAAFLPDYMVPAFFIIMDSFPLTGNGKIDRKRLPIPQETNLSTAAYEAPVTDAEQQLAALWTNLLHLPKAGRNDHFFEVGGHSLKAAQLVAIIHKHFNVDITIRQIFTTPRLRDLATFIAESSHAAHHAIRKAAASSVYPASSAEKRLFILNQIDGAGISYNIPAIYAIEGAPDRKRLTRAIRTLIDRHEILRSSFAIKDGEVIQMVEEDIDFDIEQLHCADDELTDMIRDFIRPFDLSAAPLIRAALIRTHSGQYYFALDLHHIIADGVAVDNLLHELRASYNHTALPALGIQTKDFAVWQQQWLQSPEALAQKAFWKSQFKTDISLLNMPVDFVRPPVKSYEGDVFRFNIPLHITTAIKNINRTNGATTFMVMLAAYNILLSRYSGQEDIIVGTPVAGRSNADVQPLLGMFVNTLPLRSFPAADKPFSDYLLEIKDQSLRAFENQDYPFEELVDDLEISRDMSRNPLFDYMFAYRSENRDELQLADLRLKAITIAHHVSKMDLSLEISNAENDTLLATMEYSTKIFSIQTIKRLSGHFLHILEQVALNPQITLKDIEIITAKEQEQILQFSRADGDPVATAEKDVYALFEKNATRFPDHMAVETETASITYGELAVRVSRLAAVLSNAGCGEDKIVALYTDRSIDMIVSMLAILKAGGAYLPVDPEYPQERVRYMIEDSGAILVLTQKKYAGNLAFAANKLLLDELPLHTDMPVMENINRPPHSLAYVIYTSGSTGKPKGVQIEHHSFLNAVRSNATYSSGFNTTDVCLSLSTIAFDVSVLEIFIPLVNASKLVIVNREHMYDVQSLANVIVHKGITFCYVPPSLLQPLYRVLKESAPVQLNKLFVGVEPIKDTTLQQYMSLNEHLEIINGYGPTEGAVACSWYRFKPGNPKGVNIPIGRPVHHARIYIVNEQMQLQPVGVPGELCIAGEGLARGYLNNPELTREKFADNPFEPGQRLYKTGDLAKWRPDGNLEFIGRKDYQVKIRGFRIELGEIESKLMTHPEIRQALVIDKTDSSGNKFLCAYVVSPRQLEPSVLRAHLATELPAYMIPSYFIVLEKFPLTSNEKVDRKALPEPDTEQKKSSSERVLPADATESQLLHIWETVLETGNISTTDNFFELGGNSLKIINMLTLIQQSFGDALKVSDLFDKPSIREQAAAVSNNLNKISRQPSRARRVEF